MARYVIYCCLFQFLFVLNFFCSSAFAADSVIQYDEKPSRWTITTEDSTCQLILTKDKNITPGFFGPLAGPRMFQAPAYLATTENGTSLREIPYRGGFQDMEPALEVIFPYHSREIELVYVDHSIVETDGYPTLKLVMKDSFYPLKVIKVADGYLRNHSIRGFSGNS